MGWGKMALFVPGLTYPRGPAAGAAWRGLGRGWPFLAAGAAARGRACGVSRLELPHATR